MAASNLLSAEQTAAYLHRLSQAWVAVEWYGDPQLIAAPFTWRPGASEVRLPRAIAERLPRKPFPAAVGADEGHWFFDLRGVHLKGTLAFDRYEHDAAIYRFAEDRVRGWDYRLFADAAPDLERDEGDLPLSRGQDRPDGVIRIATVSRGHRPHITPIWYRHSGARYSIMTAEPAIVVRNVQQHPRVAATISQRNGDGFYPCRLIQGRARFLKNAIANLPAVLALQGHYFLSPNGVRNTLQFARGLLQVPGYVTGRSDPGCLVLDAEFTTEVYSAEGMAGEWLEIAEAAVTT